MSVALRSTQEEITPETQNESTVKGRRESQDGENSPCESVARDFDLDRGQPQKSSSILIKVSDPKQSHFKVNGDKQAFLLDRSRASAAMQDIPLSGISVTASPKQP